VPDAVMAEAATCCLSGLRAWQLEAGAGSDLAACARHPTARAPSLVVHTSATLRSGKKPQGCGVRATEEEMLGKDKGWTGRRFGVGVGVGVGAVGGSIRR
jgi:hypothetical protein